MLFNNSNAISRSLTRVSARRGRMAVLPVDTYGAILLIGILLPLRGRGVLSTGVSLSHRGAASSETHEAKIDDALTKLNGVPSALRGRTNFSGAREAAPYVLFGIARSLWKATSALLKRTVCRLIGVPSLVEGACETHVTHRHCFFRRFDVAARRPSSSPS
jgi:hypothetical protein